MIKRSMPIEQLKVVYIAHPIGGDVEGNLQKVAQILRHLNLNSPDIIPIAPYFADVRALNDNVLSERKRGLENGLGLIRKKYIDEMWLYGDRISDGMHDEIEEALDVGIPVIPMTFNTRTEFFNFMF